ncbi:MAG: hypothetical protein ACHQE5_00075, partial [Actinomycetes bacterium]
MSAEATPDLPAVDELDRWRLWRRWAVVVWCVSLLVFIVTRGVPFERTIQTLWILLGLYAVNFGRPWRSQVRIV